MHKFKKKKFIWVITMILSFLILIGGVFFKLKDLRTYAGVTEATCVVRTRCTYQVNGVDYVYQADYYTDVNPKEPIKRDIRYNLDNPSDTHLTGMGISESCIFLAISLLILTFMYFIMKEKVLFLGSGFFALFISFLLYSPLLGSMNPLLYFKTFKYYGISTLVPLIFFLGGILFILLSFKRFVWKEKEKPVAYKKKHKFIKETKEEKVNKTFNTMFNFVIISINFIEAGIAGYAFCYLIWDSFNEEKAFTGTPAGISLTGIFVIPLFFIFTIKILDIIALYFTKNDIQEKLELFDKIKNILKFIMTIEVLCSILFLLISSIIHENFLAILFISIGFILPIALALIYTIYHFILENINIPNKEILSIDFDRISKIIGVILLSLFVLLGLIAVIGGMIYAIKEENYFILFFYFVWLIVLSIIIYFILKQSKQI